MHSAFQEDSLFDKISKLSSGFISYLLSFPLYYLLFANPHNVSVRSVGDCWTYCVHDTINCYKFSVNESMKTLHQRKKTLIKAKEMFVGWVPVDVFALSTEKCPFSVSRCDLSGVGGGSGWRGRIGLHPFSIWVIGSLSNHRDWFTE